jgi:type VI secretion system protein ImpB
MKPRAAVQVDNELQRDGTKMNVELKFQSMADFAPEAVAAQVEPLRKLMEARERLSNLLNKMDGNDKLEQLLQDVVQNTDALKRLAEQTGRSSAPGGEA